MKAFILLIVTVLLSLGLGFLSSCASKSEKDVTSHTSVGEQISERQKSSTTYRYELLLDLMYGMESNPDTRSYELRDSVLENIPSIEKRECVDYWYNNNENCYYQASLGMYYDREYPTPAVKKRVSEAVDTMLIHEIGYYFYHIDENNVRLMRDYYSRSVELDMFKFGEWLFNTITSTLKNDKPAEKYWRMYAGRVCMVTHKVFENDSLVTYIIESSVDYNGSSGCPSAASYYTYRKSDGYLFTPADLTEDFTDIQLADILEKAYVDERIKKGNGTSGVTISDNILSARIDGCAVVEGGLLFYYHPYNIGTGAEGQYNLIVMR